MTIRVRSDFLFELSGSKIIVGFLFADLTIYHTIFRMNLLHPERSSLLSENDTCKEKK